MILRTKVYFFNKVLKVLRKSYSLKKIMLGKL